jgi:PmbA protein
MSPGSLSRPAARLSESRGDGYLLQSEADLADAVTDAVERSTALGAGGAIARVSEDGGISVTVANGEVETAVRDGNQSLQITVFDNGRTGMASTESLARPAIDRVVEQAIAMARQLEADDAAGLPERDSLAWDSPSIEMFAPSFLTAETLTQDALAIESAALAVHTEDQVRVSSAGAASQDMRLALATSQGFCRTSSSSMHHRWCQTIAQRGSEMHQGSWSSDDRQADQLEAIKQVGTLAAIRALEMLGAEGLPTRRAPVLVDATVASSLVRDMCGQLTGDAQYQRNTFLPDALDQTIAASHLSVVEDPFERFGLASAAFDNEGVAGKRRDIVRDGEVLGLFLDTRMGRKLHRASTGNAGGMRNLTLMSTLTERGDDLAAMLGKMGTGLWLTRFMGGGSNPAKGVYSRAAAGFWVENGEVVRSVQGFTVAGNLKDIFMAISAVGADVHRSGAVRTGSILLPDMQIAGR